MSRAFFHRFVLLTGGLAAAALLGLAGCRGGGARLPAFSLAWSEYPSWSVFGVAHEFGLVNGAAGKTGPIEEKYGIDLVLKEADYDGCIVMYGAAQCDAACLTNINVQTLTGRAALDADTEHIVHAVAMDPLTAAVCTLKEIRDMCGEMLEAERQWLPQFEGKSVRPRPTIDIPDNCKPVDVPLDPALAIAKRFGELMDRQTD